MEIERKFLIREIPAGLDGCRLRLIEQAYLCRGPIVRVRRDNEDYYLTYKGAGTMLAHEEYNLPLTKESYEHLREKADGAVITKKRYEIPYGCYTIELDHFVHPRSGLWLAEVEFSSIEEAKSFSPPAWFGEDVTNDRAYHNSRISQED